MVYLAPIHILLTRGLYFHEGKVGKHSPSLCPGGEELMGLGEHFSRLCNQGGFREEVIPVISQDAHSYSLPCLSGWQ